MPYFFVRLTPPRPGFAQDVSAEERSAMGRHVTYWTRMVEEGAAVVFGPVASPSGFWGLGVLEAESEEAARALARRDPALTAKIGMTFDLLPMPGAIARADASLARRPDPAYPDPM